jgi:hypothetical protein
LSTAQRGGGARARNAVEDLNGGNRPTWRMGGNRLSRRRYSCALSRAVGLRRGPPRGGTSPLAGEHQKRFLEGRRSEACRLSACRLSAVLLFWGLLMKKARDEKRRALRGTMGSRTGRKGETACLARRGESRFSQILRLF